MFWLRIIEFEGISGIAVETTDRHYSTRTQSLQSIVYLQLPIENISKIFKFDRLAKEKPYQRVVIKHFPLCSLQKLRSVENVFLVAENRVQLSHDDLTHDHIAVGSS